MPLPRVLVMEIRCLDRTDCPVVAVRARCSAMLFTENAIIWEYRAALLPIHERSRAVSFRNKILRPLQAVLERIEAPKMRTRGACQLRVRRAPPRPCVP